MGLLFAFRVPAVSLHVTHETVRGRPHGRRSEIGDFRVQKKSVIFWLFLGHF